MHAISIFVVAIGKSDRQALTRSVEASFSPSAGEMPRENTAFLLEEASANSWSSRDWGRSVRIGSRAETHVAASDQLLTAAGPRFRIPLAPAESRVATAPDAERRSDAADGCGPSLRTPRI